MILGENGEKMSKSRGNVVNPDEIVAEFGADTLRVYEMFIGDFEKAAPWSSASIRGAGRFLERVWALAENLKEGDSVRPELEMAVNRTIRKVGEDIENLKFNTAIAAMMALLNDMNEVGGPNRAEYAVLVQLLNPFAPHMTEELWEQLGNTTELAYTPWPTYDPNKCTADTVEIAIQVNGKIRTRMMVGMADDAATVLAAAKANERIAPELEGKQLIKELYVPQKLVNLVVKPQ